MPDITNQSKPDALIKQLEGIARSSSRTSPALAQAVRSLLTAMDYADQQLIDSYLNSTAEAFRDLIQDTIRKELQESDALMQFLHTAWHDHCEGLCAETFDPLGKEIKSLLDERLNAMISLRDGPVKDMTDDYPIGNASELEQGIEELGKLKESIFRNWPWSSNSLPPVNRKMVAESRAAIARKEGKPVKDLIRELGGDPTKDS